MEDHRNIGPSGALSIWMSILYSSRHILISDLFLSGQSHPQCAEQSQIFIQPGTVMDGISAAAAIVGLLGAAAKVSEVLIKFIANVKEAPKLAHNVLMEMSDVGACLNQLQNYLKGTASKSSSQEKLSMIEQLVIALSNCGSIFSELEETLDSFKPAEPMQPWRLARWLFKERDISALVVRLQQSKLSLSLMLTILTW